MALSLSEEPITIT